MEVTVAEVQATDREIWRRKKRKAKERPQEHELAERPDAGDELARNRRSPRSTKTHQVEPDGAL